ncbi:MAG TPA: hypothetical protein VLG16_02970 [Candidatus Saccharimonadales bacterium]|nr:hypothetical protein [Candidatus Saccharimonadales bacterium]
MTHKEVNLFSRIFKDKEGKVIIWQSPNVLLWCWIVSSVLGTLFKHRAGHTGLQRLAEASLFAWAYLEIRTGASIFRQILGAVIITGVVYGFFTS